MWVGLVQSLEDLCRKQTGSPEDPLDLKTEHQLISRSLACWSTVQNWEVSACTTTQVNSLE